MPLLLEHKYTLYLTDSQRNKSSLMKINRNQCFFEKKIEISLTIRHIFDGFVECQQMLGYIVM